MTLSPLQIESWTEFAVGFFIILVRAAYRTKVSGWKWHGDDYFAVAAGLFFAGECVCLEVIGHWGSIIGMTEEVALSLTDAQKVDVIKGSKANVAGWCLYISLIWCLKSCMLFFYARLTLDTTQKRLVRVTACLCACTFVAMFGVVFLRCLPFQKNWQIYPYPGDSCGTLKQLNISLVVCNVVTDLMILYIPLPLLWTVQLPLSKKIIYGLWLMTGIFVVAATIVRCTLALVDPAQITAIIWSIRETFVGIIAINVPILGPWVKLKCTGLANSILSKTRSASDGKGGQPSITTIGRKSFRMKPMKKDNKTQSMPGWTTIDDEDDDTRVNKTQSSKNPTLVNSTQDSV